jgi:hypothetical protein
VSKPSLPFPLAAFEFLTNALVLGLFMVQGQESVPSVSETVENGTAS